MARDDNENAVAPEATETAPEQPTETAPEATEATEAATDAAPTAPETAPEAPAAPTGPTTEEINAALGEFANKVLGVVGFPEFKDANGNVVPEVPGTSDKASGEVSAEDIASLVEAFKALPGGTRTHNKALESINKVQIKLLTEHMHAPKARACALIGQALKEAGKTTRATREPSVAQPTKSPTELFVEQVATFALAANFLVPGEGVAEDWAVSANAKVHALSDEVATYREYLAASDAYNALSDEDKAKAEEPKAPEVDAIVIGAARVARGRTPGRRAASTPRTGEATPRAPRAAGGPRGDILAHIQEVFADKPIGTVLKVSEIANTVTSHYGGSNAPASGGAVSSRIQKPTWAAAAPNLKFISEPNLALEKVA